MGKQAETSPRLGGLPPRAAHTSGPAKKHPVKAQMAGMSYAEGKHFLSPDGGAGGTGFAGAKSVVTSGKSQTQGVNMAMPGTKAGEKQHYRFDLADPTQNRRCEAILSRAVVENRENIRNERLNGKPFQMYVSYVLPSKGILEFDYVVTDERKARMPMKQYSFDLSKAAERERAKRIWLEDQAVAGRNIGMARLDGESVAVSKSLFERTKGILRFYYSPPDFRLDDQPAPVPWSVVYKNGYKPEMEEKYATEWKRIPGDAFVKGDGDKSDIDPNDITQGMIGDCYLMAALGAVAKTDPGIIRKMVKKVGDGVYRVRFYIWDDKKKKPERHVDIPVDDQFVTLKKIANKPAYAKEGDRKTDPETGQQKTTELWVMLVEKAWAKFKGSFKNIHLGNPSPTLQAITGKASREEVTRGKAPSEVERDLAEAVRNGHPATASTFPDDKIGEMDAAIRNQFNEMGLHGQHAYTVLGAGKGVIRLRDPHGDNDPEVPVDLFWNTFNRYHINKA